MKSTKCVACGFVGFSDEMCKACGAPMNQRSASAPPVAPVYATQYHSWNQPEGKQKGMAIAALVLGIISFMTLGLIGLGAITGIIMACVAISRARREPQKYGGRGMAITGLVLCLTSLVMIVPVGIFASIFIPNLIAARMAANEASAIASLRDIAVAESNYLSAYRKFGTLEELGASNLLDPTLATGEKNGYQFTIVVESPETFEVNAVPTAYRSSGLRSFYVDESTVIRAGNNFGGPSSKMDEPVSAESEFQRRRSNRRANYRGDELY